MIKQQVFICSVLLALLLTSNLAVPAHADLDLTYQAFQQGQFGQALQQWQTILPELKGSERIDTLLHMAEASSTGPSAGSLQRSQRGSCPS